MKNHFLALAVLLLAMSRISFGNPASDDLMTVDLHAHPFMKEGMGIMVKGTFDGPLVAKDWKNLFAAAMNAETLEQSGNRIVVVSLYANPIFKWSLRDAIRKQIALTEKFVASHPGWIIAHTPEQARLAIAAGKRVLVFGLERASGILDTEADLKEFVDDKGIAIVTFLHIDDDKNGGGGFLPHSKRILNPGNFARSLVHPKYEEGVLSNSRGLTKRGDSLLRALIRHKVWVDLSHASLKSQRDAIPILESAGQPLLYTHTALKRYLGAERAIGDPELLEVKKTGGIVGILPSEEMLEGTPVAPKYCPVTCICDGSVAAMATQYAEFVDALGPKSVMLGSDFNGGVNHLKPSCRTQTELDQAKGLWNVGQTGALWQSLVNTGAPVPQRRAEMVDGFLEGWERVVK